MFTKCFKLICLWYDYYIRLFIPSLPIPIINLKLHSFQTQKSSPFAVEPWTFHAILPWLRAVFHYALCAMILTVLCTQRHQPQTARVVHSQAELCCWPGWHTSLLYSSWWSTYGPPRFSWGVWRSDAFAVAVEEVSLFLKLYKVVYWVEIIC